jgi:hypothetical protein
LTPQGSTVPGSISTSETSANGQPGSTFAVDGPFSADGIQVLLTNYLGIDNQKARQVINSIDDCACDKSLTPEELAAINTAITEG